MTATAIRVFDDATGSNLTDTRDSYLQGLTYNATQDRFYFCRTTTTSDCVWQYVEGDLSATGNIGGNMSAIHDWSAASDDGDYLVNVYPNSTTGYYLGRLTLSTETASNTIQTWSPAFVTQRARIGCTGTDSFVILYHGPNEKVHGTSYERLYYRTYVPSTNTLGSETIVSGSGIVDQTGQSTNYTIYSSSSSIQMRGDYTQDRAHFYVDMSSQGIYYDASAGAWTGWSYNTTPGVVHNYNGGTEEFFSPGANQVVRRDGWGGSATAETGVTGAANNKDNLLHVDHANDEVYLTQMEGIDAADIQWKKRSTGGTWDSSWTVEPVSLTGALSQRVDVSNDARFFSISGSPVLVRTVVTNQSSGRGLHLIKINLGAAPVTKNHTTDAVLKPRPKTHTTDAILVDRSTVAHTTDALLSTQVTVAHTTDARLTSPLERMVATNGYVDLPADGDFISTPDHADFDVPTNGVIDLRADVALNSYTGATVEWLIGKWTNTAASDSWAFGWNQSNENMRLTYRNDAQAQTTHVGTALTGLFSANQRVQLRVRFDTAGGTDSVAFYYRTDGDIASDTGWTAAGTQSPSADTIQDTTTNVELIEQGGAQVPTKYHAALVKVDGTTVADPRFSNAIGTPVTDYTGKVWTLQGGATFVPGWSHTTDAILEAPPTLTEFHTTDAVLFAQIQIDHTTDAVLVSRQTVAHTTDALLSTQQSVAHTSDALLVARVTVAHTTDAVLVSRQTVQHSTDAVLLGTQAVDHTTDARLIALGTVIHSTDAILLGSSTVEHTTDALLVNRQTVEHTTDALLQEVLSVSHTSDAILQATVTVEHTTDAVLRATVTIDHTTDAILSAAVQVDHTTDALLVSRQSVAHTADAVVVSRQIVLHTADGLLVARQSVEHSTDAIILITATVEHTTDASLLGTITVEHTTDARLQGAGQIIHETDAILRATIPVVHTADALLVARQAVDHTTDAILASGTQTVEHTGDALLVTRQSVEHTTDAVLLTTLSVDHTTDAVLQATQAVDHTTDGVLKSTVQVTHTTNAILTAGNTLLHSTDAVLLGTITAAHTTDAVLIVRSTESHTTDAVIRQSSTVVHTTDAVLESQGLVVHTTDAILFATVSLVHTTDAELTDRLTQAHTTDAVLVLNLALNHSTDAILQSTSVVDHTTDALLVQIVAHTADAILLGTLTVAHTADAYILSSQQLYNPRPIISKDGSADIISRTRNTGIISRE